MALDRRVCLPALGFLLLLGIATPARAQHTPSASLGPSQVKLPDKPGSAAGLADPASINVFSAQVVYSVPIAAPKGGGPSPGLAFEYDGAVGNGSLGVGWNLRVPAIRRSTRQGVPHFDESDELILEGVAIGGRLVAIAPGDYRVEGQGNRARVRRQDNFWIVQDGTGVTYQLGVLDSERQGDPGRVSAWFVHSVEDQTGEKMRFAWRRDQGAVYLDKVTWGPARRIEVDYETRPDQQISWQTGSRVVHGLRVARVRVQNAGTELRAYHLDYDDELSLSRLVRVEMTGLGGAGALPATSFTYVPTQAMDQRALPGTAGWTLDERGVTFHDVDGDGVDDLLRLEMGNHVWKKNLGGRFGDERRLVGAEAVELAESRFVDLDGDARAELVRVVDDTWRYYRLAGGTWQGGGTWNGTHRVPLVASDGAVHVDVNGDGRVDVVEAVTGGLRVRPGRDAGLAPAVALPRIAAGEPGLEPGLPGARFVDVNGDSLVDVVSLTDAWMKIYLGRGDGTFEPFARRNYPWVAGGFDLAQLHVVDLDGDGFADLVRTVNGHVLYYPADASLHFPALPRKLSRPEAASGDVVIDFVDANGNGSRDVVWSSPRGMWLLDLAGASSAGLLESIHDGLGRTTEFVYGSSGLLAIEAELSGQAWSSTVPTSMPVPVSVETHFADGTPSRIVHHGVRNGFWDGQERRFGGFLVGVETRSGATAAEVRVSTTTYHDGPGQDRALRGKVARAEIRSGSGQLFSVSESEWETRAVAGLGSSPLLRCAVTTETRNEVHENVSPPIVTRQTFVFDGQCRAVKERHEGRVDVAGDEKVTVRVYASDDSRWIRDLVVSESLLTGAEVEFGRSIFYFADENGLRGYGQVGKGWPGATDVLLVSPAGQRWIRREQATYDARGNPFLIMKDGVTRTITWSPDGLYPLAESVKPTASRKLEWKYGWDEVRVLPISSTDPNGDKTIVTYDEVERLSTIAVNGAPAHTHFVYDWAPPRAVTHSYVFDGHPAQLAGLAGKWKDGTPWRQTASVFNAAGEEQLQAVRLGPERWIVSGWQDRDARGRVVGVGDPFYWDQAGLPLTRPPTAVLQTVRYDALDRVVEQKLASGARLAVSRQGLCETKAVDGLAPTRTCVDGLGRVVRSDRTVAGVVESVDASYDVAGNLLSMSLQGGAAVHSFVHDNLGRMLSATDPDVGLRTFEYDDGNRPTKVTNAAGQSVVLTYDAAGRLLTRTGHDGKAFKYNYDLDFAGRGDTRVKDRLGWIEEPTGRVTYIYDEYGHVRRQTRIIDGEEAWAENWTSPSGLLLKEWHSDEFSIEHTYDPAGRLTKLGPYWQAIDMDAGGRVLQEKYGNQLTGTATYDIVGQENGFTLRRGTTALYDVDLERTLFGSVSKVIDLDGRGLDHSARYGYDGAGRLLDAILGPTDAGGTPLPAAYRFQYTYDGLQNMRTRTASGPKALGIFTGTYRFGEGGKGPRQLTSILSASGQVRAMVYDVAGRQTRDGDLQMTWDGLDNLVKVEKVGTTIASTHAYGFDGQRIRTANPDGSVDRWFFPDVVARADGRTHYLSIGDRQVARVRMVPVGSAAVAPPLDLRPIARGALLAATLLLAAALLRRGWRRPGWRPSLASLLALLIFAPACESFLGTSRSAAWSASEVVYLHHGYSAGPAVVTRSDGSILEERRHEPFGAPIDRFTEVAGGASGSVGDVSYAAEPHNSLGKPADAMTGWSYHGARWMSPATGRWISPDPVSKQPDPKLLTALEDLSPYQYARQQPTRFWDADGRRVFMLFVHTVNDPGGDKNLGEYTYRAALTRYDEIENSKGFDRSKDIILIRLVPDLENLKGQVDADVARFSPAYGKTVEVSFFGHGAADMGPSGDLEGKDGTSVLSFPDWKAINFNWDASSSYANFYICNGWSFANAFHRAQPGATYVSGFVDKAYPSPRKKYVAVRDREDMYPVYIVGGPDLNLFDRYMLHIADIGGRAIRVAKPGPGVSWEKDVEVNETKGTFGYVGPDNNPWLK